MNTVIRIVYHEGQTLSEFFEEKDNIYGQGFSRRARIMFSFEKMTQFIKTHANLAACRKTVQFTSRVFIKIYHFVKKKGQRLLSQKLRVLLAKRANI